ncbi:MAG: hypothetical protein L6R42_005420 [Xanthoria sp. 1 TBL-2021]|nr:MAG: hypothetical protein L6R42_005420 [Xanthoria sp. 1 TBL-2021]
MLTPIATPGCGFKVNLDVDDDSENLNGTMSDTSGTTVLGDVVEDSVEKDSVEEDSVEEDSVEEDSVEDSHSAETMIDTEADFDAELQNFLKPERSEVDEVQDLPFRENPNPNRENVERAQPSSMRQLTIFREMSHDIEDQVLKTHKIKFRKSRRRNHFAKVKTAFKEGQRDSKKMQFKAARINPRDDRDHAEDIMDTAE